MKKRLWVLVIAAMLLCLPWVRACADNLRGFNLYTLILDDNYEGPPLYII